jgi:hypothetical protein
MKTGAWRYASTLTLLDSVRILAVKNRARGVSFLGKENFVVAG